MNDSKIEEYKKLIESVKLMRDYKGVKSNNNIFDYCIFIVVLMCFMILMTRLLPSPVPDIKHIPEHKYNQLFIKY